METRHSFPWAWTLIFTTIPFWMLTSWPHYFVYLPLAQFFCLAVILGIQSPTWSKSLRLVTWVLAAGLSNVILFTLLDRWGYYSQQGFLFFSNLLLVLLVYSLVLSRVASKTTSSKGL